VEVLRVLLVRNEADVLLGIDDPNHVSLEEIEETFDDPLS